MENGNGLIAEYKLLNISETFWIDRLDVSGEMVNIEDDECNPVSSSKTRRDRSYPRTIDEEPKNTFFG